MSMKACVPILRMFDEAVTKAFYLDFLGFHPAWEHRFSDAAPLYMEIHNGGCVIQLSGHFGDSTPGSAIRIRMQERELRAYMKELREKRYRHCNPGDPVLQPWGELEITLTNPSGNKLCFHAEPENQRKSGTIMEEIHGILEPLLSGGQEPVEIRCTIEGTASGIPGAFVDALDREGSSSERLHELLVEFAEASAHEANGDIPKMVVIWHGGGPLGDFEMRAE